MLPAYGLYTHIRANEIRSRLLIAGLFLLVLAFAFGSALVVRGWTAALPRGLPPTLGGYLTAAWRDMVWLAPLAALGTFAWLFVAYHLHQRLIDTVAGSRLLTRSEAPRLHARLEALCISRGLAVPALRIVESEALNAYATGLNPGQYAITVTRGLLEALDEAEVEAVLAHELTHIRNDDVRTMMIAVVLVGILSFVGEMAWRWGPDIGAARRRSSDDKRAGALPALVIGVLVLAAAWILSQVIRFALSRAREYVADAGAVELTKDPDALIRALQKIAGRGEIEGVPSGVMELCLDNPRSGFADLFATHPAIEDRIAALARYAGGAWPAAPMRAAGAHDLIRG